MSVFSSLFPWDVNIFNGDVEEAHACWNMWAQQYLTLLSNTDFHSRGSDQLKQGSLHALLFANYQLHIDLIWSCLTALFLLSELHISPSCLNTTRFRTFLSDILSAAHSLVPAFHVEGSPSDLVTSLT